MSSLFFQISSLFYLSLISIAYFVKKKFDTIENRIYTTLIIITFITLVFDILSVYMGIKYVGNVWTIILCKLYLVCIIAWVITFTYYIFIISRNDNINSIESNNSKLLDYGKSLRITIGIFAIATGIIFMATLNIFSDGTKMYTYGPSATASYVFTALCIVFWVVCMISNHKKIRDKKYLPVIMFALLAGIAVVIQSSFPSVLLVSSAATFITVLTYFTIENPDVKLINELDFAKTQAEKANSAKTDFLSSMSHEIRTPLNAIVGFSQALADEELSEEGKNEVNDIIIASQNLLEIVNGILDISKIEAEKLEIINTEYNFKNIFNELVTLTKVRMGNKPIELRTICDQSIPDVLYGDHTRIKQIILNLLTNAAKYTDSGHITFNVTSVRKENICRLIISVEDTGIGIKDENTDKLFTKFERFDEERNITIEGTGLGLAITKKLLDLMNGKIVVQSIYGRGSKFTVAIDQRVIKEKETIKEEKKDEINNIDFSNKSILIVDDNKVNLKVAQRLLRDYNIKLELVESGYDAIDKLQRTTYDLILMDDMMPKMSGVETLHKLKEDSSFNIPVIALTANVLSGMKEKYLNEGFNEYLAKPIDKNELERILINFLGN